MMNPSDLCSLCEGWIDQDLSAQQLSAFEAHLGECDECQRRLARWQELEQDIVAALRWHGANGPLAERTALAGNATDPESEVSLAALQTPWFRASSRPGRQKSKSANRFWLAAATVILAALVGWWAIGGRSGSPQQTASSESENPTGPGQPSSESMSTRVEVKVQDPVIALKPVTRPSFTIVNVYPIFKPLASEAAN